jgi:hypothetical protein
MRGAEAEEKRLWDQEISNGINILGLKGAYGIDKLTLA